MTRRERIIAATTDLVGALVYYDRKDDEDLPRGEIEAAIEAGDITPEIIIETFADEIRRRFPAART